MGLDVSHGAFNGAYSAFNRFRKIVAEAIGGSYPPHKSPLVCSDGDIIVSPDQNRFYVPGSRKTFQVEQPGISAFLLSNDCEGEFSPELCKQMADELEAILPRIEKLDDGGAGHIERDGGFLAVTKRYIEGCRLAHSENENLRYY